MTVKQKYIFVYLLSACSNESELGRFCPKDCYSGNPKTKNVGKCKSGTPTCDENFNIVECFGEVLPTEEICNGLDESCNSVADDSIYPLRPHSFWIGRYGLEKYPCSIVGECSKGVADCINGKWECSYPETVEMDNGQITETETRCDGLDGSCNGRIDENIVFDPPYCFDGTIFQATNPPCRPGVFICNNGQKICEGQILPSPEICDQIDNDCSGVIDDTEITLSTKYDICFIVDTSGSMCPIINAVVTALDAYSSQFDNNQNFQFCLVNMSHNPEPYIWIESNFTDFANIVNSLWGLACSGWYRELSLDSMYQVCKQTNPLNLNWRQDSNRLFFLFTDERAQTNTIPYTTGQMIIDACLGTSTLPFIWSITPSDFAYIAQGANGQHFLLTNEWEVMFNDMNSIIIQLCRELRTNQPLIQ